MTLSNTIYRLGFRVLYWGFRLVTAVFRPELRGTMVFVWVDERFLVVRASYRKVWGVPGGMVKRKEDWADAARREMAEEVGLEVSEDDLRFVAEMSGFSYPNERVQAFEVQLADEPEVIIDHREIVDARFVTVKDAWELPLMEGVQRYLEERGSTPCDP